MTTNLTKEDRKRIAQFKKDMKHLEKFSNEELYKIKLLCEGLIMLREMRKLNKAFKTNKRLIKDDKI